MHNLAWPSVLVRSVLNLPGALGIVDAKLIPKLVEKLKIELEEMKELILDTLHFCMRVDATSALNAGLMPVLKVL